MTRRTLFCLPLLAFWKPKKTVWTPIRWRSGNETIARLPAILHHGERISAKADNEALSAKPEGEA